MALAPPPAVTNSGSAIPCIILFEHMDECNQNPGPTAPQRMTEGNSSTIHIYAEASRFINFVLASPTTLNASLSS